MKPLASYQRTFRLFFFGLLCLFPCSLRAEEFVVPYSPSLGRPVVNVSLDGVPFRLVVDTGSPRTSLKPSTFDRLMENHLDSDRESLSVKTIVIGKHTLSHHLTVSRLERDDLQGLDGLLGNDVLEQLRFGLNFRDRQVTFWTGRDANFDIQRSRFFNSQTLVHIIPLEKDLGIYWLPVTLGGVTLTAVLDTGAWSSILPRRLAHLMEAREVDINPRMEFLWGNFPGRLMVSKNARIGRLRFFPFAFIRIDASIDEYAVPLIGVPVFESYKLIFDLKRGRLYTQQQTSNPRRYPLFPFGLCSVGRTPSYGEIYAIVQDSAAWKAGLRSVRRVIRRKFLADGRLQITTQALPMLKNQTVHMTTVLVKRRLFTSVSTIPLTLKTGESVVYYFPHGGYYAHTWNSAVSKAKARARTPECGFVYGDAVIQIRGEMMDAEKSNIDMGIGQAHHISRAKLLRIRSGGYYEEISSTLFELREGIRNERSEAWVRNARRLQSSTAARSARWTRTRLDSGH